MKYGDKLPLYSAPEFASYNLEYAVIKTLIKKKTIGIPPLPNATDKTDFEDEIFAEFHSQLDHINLFVKCKAGEISRRIDITERKLWELDGKQRARSNSSKLYARYEKIESEVEKIGNDIQAVSRFCHSNRIGFHKLLKKYKKWTGSGTLHTRFLPLLNAPESFTRQDIDALLYRMTTVLDAVRSRLTNIANLQPSTGHPSQNVFAPYDMEVAVKRNSEFDTLLNVGNYHHAAFWVHYSYLVELQIFILKFLSLRSWSALSSPPGTPLDGPNGPFTSKDYAYERLRQQDDRYEMIVYDNAEDFLRRVGQQSNLGGDDPIMPFATIKHTMEGDYTSFAIGLSSSQSVRLVEGSREAFKSLMKNKSISEIRDFDSEFAQILEENPKISPLVKISASRARYCNSSRMAFPLWATLDRDIVVRKPEKGARGEAFPHAVLQIYWQESETPELVKALQDSHLVKYVPGFSIEAHAIVNLHSSPEIFQRVPWVSKLQEDLRKDPPPSQVTVLPNNKAAKKARSGSPVTVVSESANSTNAGTSSRVYSTEATDDEIHQNAAADIVARRNSSKKRGRQGRKERTWLGQERYWNEFDNDNDSIENQPFAVVIHPDDAPTSMFGGILDSFKSLFQSSTPDERRPLLESTAASPFLRNDIEPGNSEMILVNRYPSIRGYTYFYSGCFAVASACLILSGVFVKNQPSKGQSQDAWFEYTVRVALTVAASICLAVAGISLYLARGRAVSTLHSIMVYSFFTLVCFGNGIVLAYIETSDMH